MSGSGVDQGTGVTAVAVLRSAGEPGKASPMAREQLVVARVETVALCGVAIALGILFKGQNIAFLVGLATAVAASANFPVIVLAIFWPRLTTLGAAAGMLTGLITDRSILLIYLSPLVQVDILQHAAPIIGLRNPAIVSMPVAFMVCMVVSLLTGTRETRDRYAEVERRILLGDAA
jgi:cation/acetate symporter